ncbi:hypothetical protein C6H68_25365 [Photorhabdus luminescens]|nr:hypothetical protein C6H68_25365 [Photorhabdus luminescens]
MKNGKKKYFLLLLGLFLFPILIHRLRLILRHWKRKNLLSLLMFFAQKVKLPVMTLCILE